VGLRFAARRDIAQSTWRNQYYATKAAMIHLTRTTAVEYAPKHIRVNAVLSGLMNEV